MQTGFDFPAVIQKDSYDYGSRSSGETHGVVLTKPHIVELILELVDYQPERDLAKMRLLEPSCGHGAFLVAAAQRLLRSAKRHGRTPSELETALLAVDVDPAHVEATRQNLMGVLGAAGITGMAAKRLVERWVVCADFLLTPIAVGVDFIVGNPPYVRIEQIPVSLQAEYRSRYVSLYDRADLYVAFIERALSLLSSEGALSLICADRWTRNRYGAPLRRLISEHFVVRSYLDLSSASPFDSEVSAYPSIFVISPKGAQTGPDSAVPVVMMTDASAEECLRTRSLLQKGIAALRELTESEPMVRVHDSWFVGDEPWVLGDPEQVALLRRLEKAHPLLDECGGIHVGIGVATGLDRVYILDRQQAQQIEPDRTLPLVMRQDLCEGQVCDGGRFVISTFDHQGRPIELERYPRLAQYFCEHEQDVKQRHVAKRSGTAWFRTIDRVYPELVRKPKLLIPDIAGANEITLEQGHYYPHHNLYFVTAESYDIEVLGGLLSSKVALFFIWSYAVKMRGGYLRFQAQYLRRIRVPREDSLPTDLQEEIRKSFRRRDFASLDALALRAYGIEQLPPFDFTDTRR